MSIYTLIDGTSIEKRETQLQGVAVGECGSFSQVHIPFTGFPRPCRVFLLAFPNSNAAGLLETTVSNH